jgi:hypothetical protein
VCVVSLCALMLVSLSPVVRGITSLCFADGTNDWTSAIGGRYGLTFEHRQVLPWAVKVEGMSRQCTPVYCRAGREATMV